MKRHIAILLLLVLVPALQAQENVPENGLGRDRTEGSGGNLAITTESLPKGRPGHPYEATLAAEGGTEPYAWSAPTVPEPVVGTASTFSAAGEALDCQEDDGCMELALSFPFPYFGKAYDTVWVDTNGRLALARDYDSRYAYDAYAFLSIPTIAVLWDDLTTSEEGCDIFLEKGDDAVTIRWAARYYDEDGDGGAANISATLHRDGRIVLRYGAGNAAGGFVGFSAGDGSTHVDLEPPEGGRGGAPDVTFSAPGSVLPSWLSLDSGDGTLAGTPANPCDVAVPLTVTDAAGASATTTFSILVEPDPLAIATNALPAGMTGVRYEAEIRISGGVMPYKFVHGDDDPDWEIPVHLSMGANGTCVVSGTPGAEDAGSYSFVLRIVDARGTVASQRFSLTIAENPNRRPTIVSASPEAGPGAVVRVASDGYADFAIEATDSDGDPLSFAWSVYDDPDWNEVTNGLGSEFRFEPETGVAGLFHVSGSVTDGLWNEEVEWTVYVGEPEDLVITTESLPDADEGTDGYDFTFACSGGVEPVEWELESDELPGDGYLWEYGGLEFYRIDHPGDWTISVKAEDRLGRVARKSFTLHVAPGVRTANSPVPVPCWWIDKYACDALDAADGDYEAAAVAEAKNGNGLVWQCFLAGLAPEDFDEYPWGDRFFRADIRLDGGSPVVTWEPDLGRARAYAVEGKEKLSDPTWGPTNAASRFFRVKVRMP